MSIAYRLAARASDGRNVSAVFTTNALIPADRRDTFLLPGEGGFSCVGCTGFHFLQYGSYAILQFNDRVTWNAESFIFPLGTFQQFGTFRSSDGLGTLEVVDLDPHPVSLVSTMNSSSNRSWALAGGSTFEQRFKAKDSGVPTELGVRMGINQNPYSVQLRILLGDTVILDRNYPGLVQRRSDWATVFDLTGLTTRVPAGAWVTVCLTPDQQIGIEPLFLDDPDVPRGDLPRYGSMNARFYMDGMSALPTA